MEPGLLEDLGRWDLPPLPGVLKRRPSVTAPLAAAVEPFEDQPFGEPCESSIAFRVTDDPIVVPDSLQLALERGDDLGKREAPRFLEPVLERRESSSELLRVGGAPHPPAFRIASAFRPIEVEAEEGELPAAFSFPPVEFHQRALLFGELQSELGQPFGQRPQVGLGIVFSLETNDAVIRITPEQHASLAFLGDIFLDPQVLDEVKIDVS